MFLEHTIKKDKIIILLLLSMIFFTISNLFGEFPLLLRAGELPLDHPPPRDPPCPERCGELPLEPPLLPPRCDDPLPKSLVRSSMFWLQRRELSRAGPLWSDLNNPGAAV
jgi:hypothetical protein